MNVRIFKSHMVINDDNQTTLANALGISSSALSCKLSEKRGSQFKQKEIMNIKTRWGLSAEQVDEIFFNDKVS